MKNRIYLIFFIVLIFFACKKNSQQPNPTVVSLVKTMVTKHTSLGFLIDSTTFYYDAQNRITKEILIVKDSSSVISSQELNYEYKSDSLIISTLSNRYKLNENGLVENDVNIYLSRYFYYDNNSFLKKTSFVYNLYPYTNNRDSFIVDNQNTRTQYQFKDDILSYGTVIMQYEFYNNENTIKNINMGKAFLGNSNKNLIKSINSNSSATTKSSGFTTNTIIKFFYTYLFDEENRVIKKIQTSDTNADSSFTYIEYY